MTVSDRRGFLQQMAGSMAAVALVPHSFPAALRSRAGAPLPVGVVGLGHQGTRLIAELLQFEQVEVAAICDVRESRLRRGMRRAPGASTYSEVGALLAAKPAVEAVFVATPTHLHRQVVEAVLGAGKHVYCEAPMASSLEDLQALAAASRTAKVIFQIGHQVRSNPVYQLARSFVRAGNIRDVILARARSHQKASWRVAVQDPAEDRNLNWRLYADTSTGLPGEMGSHQFDMMSWFLNQYPLQVQGHGSVLVHDDGREVADTVNCQLQFPGEVWFTFEGTLGNSFQGTHEQLIGTMGSIRMAGTHGWMFKESDAPTQGWEVYASRQKFHNEEGITLIADATKLAKQGKLTEGIGLPNPPLHYAVEDFLKSILEQKNVVCTAADGLRAGVVGLLCHQAVSDGKPRTVDPELLKVPGT
jgi:predicted dehydrogenase